MPVIKHILSSGFATTILTRNAPRYKKSQHYTDLPNGDITVVGADYSDVSQLTSLLHGHAAVVVLISRIVLEPQLRIIDAAIAAGVPRVIPSCFGLDSRNPKIRNLPAVEAKIAMQGYVVQKAKEGKIVFTGLQTSIFFEWALWKNVILNCEDEKGVTMVYDGGDTQITTTSLETIGEAVVAVLRKPIDDEGVRNKFLFLQTALISNNQMLSWAKEMRPEWEWKSVSVDTEELERKSWEAYGRGERGLDTMRGFVARASFGEGLGRLDAQKVEEDMRCLGITGWEEKRVKEVVRKYVMGER